MIEKDYLRITDIISPFTGIEFVNEDLLKNAAQRGTDVHSLIEAFIEGFEKPVPEPLFPYMESFRHFWEDSFHIFDGGALIQERRLYCEELKITGKPDLLVTFDDRTYIIDWKTSSSPSISWRLQGAAYKYLCKENGYENVDNVLFVQLNKYGKGPTLKKYESYEEDLEIFKKCLELYRFFNMEKTRKEK